MLEIVAGLALRTALQAQRRYGLTQRAARRDADCTVTCSLGWGALGSAPAALAQAHTSLSVATPLVSSAESFRMSMVGLKGPLLPTSDS
jgi:hypothetical protein